MKIALIKLLINFYSFIIKPYIIKCSVFTRMTFSLKMNAGAFSFGVRGFLKSLFA